MFAAQLEDTIILFSIHTRLSHLVVLLLSGVLLTQSPTISGIRRATGNHGGRNILEWIG